MKSFVAASCCLIVGLEILIGVPLAVCLSFFCLDVGVAVPGVQVADAGYVSPTCPPPIYSAPVFSPGPVPCGPYDPACLPPPLPPTNGYAASAVPVVASLPASDPACDPAPRAPSVASPPPRPNASAECQLESSGLQFLAHVCVEGDCPDAACTEAECMNKPTGEPALVESLLATAQLLYQQAERHEADTEYDRADRLRMLARDLRDEAQSILRRLPTNTLAPETWPAAEPANQAVAPASAAEPRTVTVGPPPLG
jgi:hypothetical protein